MEFLIHADILFHIELTSRLKRIFIDRQRIFTRVFITNHKNKKREIKRRIINDNINDNSNNKIAMNDDINIIF